MKKIIIIILLVGLDCKGQSFSSYVKEQKQKYDTTKILKTNTPKIDTIKKLKNG